jgi:hypothetical protein
MLMPSLYPFAVRIRVPLFIIYTPNALTMKQKGGTRQISRIARQRTPYFGAHHQPLDGRSWIECGEYLSSLNRNRICAGFNKLLWNRLDVLPLRDEVFSFPCCERYKRIP